MAAPSRALATATFVLLIVAVLLLAVAPSALAADPPVIDVTAPANGDAFLPLATTNVTWTLSAATSVGSFQVWAHSATQGWFQLNLGPIPAVANQTSYSMPWTVLQPAAADYTVRVLYVDGDGLAASSADSSGTFTIGSVAPTVTAPTNGDAFLPLATTNVTWTLSAATSVGSFQVWAHSATQGWFQLNLGPIPAVANQTSYSMPWTVLQPAAADYTVRVLYVDGDGLAASSADSSGTFTIGTVAPTVTAPTNGDAFLPLATTNVTWTLSAATSVGSFQVWAHSATQGWFQLNLGPIPAVANQTSYSMPWTVLQPAAADYTVRVLYVDGDGLAASSADSSGTFTIGSRRAHRDRPGERRCLPAAGHDQRHLDARARRRASAPSRSGRTARRRAGSSSTSAPSRPSPDQTSYSMPWTVAAARGRRLHGARPLRRRRRPRRLERRLERHVHDRHRRAHRDRPDERRCLPAAGHDQRHLDAERGDERRLLPGLGAQRDAGLVPAQPRPHPGRRQTRPATACRGRCCSPRPPTTRCASSTSTATASPPRAPTRAARSRSAPPRRPP